MTKIILENGSSITPIQTDSGVIRSTIKQWDIDIDKFIAETYDEIQENKSEEDINNDR